MFFPFHIEKHTIYNRIWNCSKPSAKLRWLRNTRELCAHIKWESNLLQKQLLLCKFVIGSLRLSHVAWECFHLPLSRSFFVLSFMSNIFCVEDGYQGNCTYSIHFGKVWCFKWSYLYTIYLVGEPMNVHLEAIHSIFFFCLYSLFFVSQSLTNF